MNSEIKFLVDDEKIGHSEQAFIVAEISSNHNNNLDRTKEIIDGIAKTSAKGIKFQTYKPESLIVNSDKPYILPDNNEWAGEDLSELYKKEAFHMSGTKNYLNTAMKRINTLF